MERKAFRLNESSIRFASSDGANYTQLYSTDTTVSYKCAIFMQLFNEKNIAMQKGTRNKNGELEICPALFLLKVRERFPMLA